jgi:hypothetical protein
LFEKSYNQIIGRVHAMKLFFMIYKTYSLRPAKSVHFDFFSQTIWSLTKFITKNMNIYNIK